MESHIRVMATVDEMKEAFDSDSDLYSVRHYSILIDDSQYTDEEWEKVKNQKYPFKMIIRHEEYPTRLNEKKMYSSWNAVVNSLTMNPHILYWKWNDDVLNEDVMRERTLDIINRSSFDYIYISFHSISPENRILSSDKSVDMLRKCVELFGEHGRKVIIDTELTLEGEYIKKNFKSFAMSAKRFDGVIGEDGTFACDAEGATVVLGCWAVEKISEKEFINPVKITDGVIKDGAFKLSGKGELAGKSVVLYLARQTLGLDSFDEGTHKAKREIFERLKDIPFGGAATDEKGLCGLSLVRDPVDKSVKVNPELHTFNSSNTIDDLDINKINFYINWMPYSDNMAKAYEQECGSSLADDLLYFWHIEKGNESKSIRVCNTYFEVIRKKMSEAEAEQYDLTKEYFGETAFVGTHNTWWGDELDNNFDKYFDGLDWWETKRDYAQTDELILIPIRLAMARKCKKNIWYNMWYSMRTLDIKTYYKETYTNVIYGGRTHYLGYECYEPDVVLCFNKGDHLENLTKTESKVDVLDDIQTSRPDSRVLVIFGYEAATNHHISEPDGMRENRRGEIIHKVLKTTKEIFNEYLCELAPSTELDNGSISLDNGKAVYGGHEYDTVVVMYPNGITKASYDKIKSYSKNNGSLIVCGDIDVFHNGEKAEGVCFENAICFDEPDAEKIIEIFEKNNIKNNKGENYCVFEDGSVTIANIAADKPVGNGVECESYGVSDKECDIVYIAPHGNKVVI